MKVVDSNVTQCHLAYQRLCPSLSNHMLEYCCALYFHWENQPRGTRGIDFFAIISSRSHCLRISILEVFALSSELESIGRTAGDLKRFYLVNSHDFGSVALQTRVIIAIFHIVLHENALGELRNYSVDLLSLSVDPLLHCWIILRLKRSRLNLVLFHCLSVISHIPFDRILAWPRYDEWRLRGRILGRLT